MEHTSNAKILIADENAAQRTQLRESLTRAGYRNVEEAVNGDDALHKIDRLHPDIAIIDIWLSKLDGIGKVSVERIHITPIPRHFNSMTDGAFHARGGCGVLLGNRRVQYLRY